MATRQLVAGEIEADQAERPRRVPRPARHVLAAQRRVRIVLRHDVADLLAVVRRPVTEPIRAPLIAYVVPGRARPRRSPVRARARVRGLHVPDRGERDVLQVHGVRRGQLRQVLEITSDGFSGVTMDLDIMPLDESGAPISGVTVTSTYGWYHGGQMKCRRSSRTTTCSSSRATAPTSSATYASRSTTSIRWILRSSTRRIECQRYDDGQSGFDEDET